MMGNNYLTYISIENTKSQRMGREVSAVPLKVFHLMLLHGTFRMNSIVSQSDTQETFYLGDFVCSDYEDEFKRFCGMLSEQTVLISSFTTKHDDAYMWKEYGDDGRGACLGFRLTGGQKLRQMQYIDEKTTELRKYKHLVDQLKEEGVHVHFSAIDDWHRFVKNDKYHNQSILIGPNQPDGTSNFPLLAQRAHKLFGKEIIVNRSDAVLPQPEKQ